MSITMRKLTLSFPQRLVREPILHNIATRFGVSFNISKANVTDEHGYLEISLEGGTESLDQAIEYLRGLGVQINAS
jgi:ABC-type methionine transport system ATPase subunit